MENVTLVQIKDFVIVLLAILGVIVLVGNAIKVIKEWNHPRDDLASWRQDVDIRLNGDQERLSDLEEGNKVICRGILAMLSHEINGNSNDKLIASQQELTNYLINR